MRIFFSRCKRFGRDITAFLLCLGGALVFFVFSAERFPIMEGKRTYYLYSASSQSKQVKKLSGAEAKFLKGESVRFSFSDEKIVKEILEAYDAKVVYTERVGDILSYYAYTPKFADGVVLEGKKVNLHIALNEETRTGGVGSPILFGGY